MKRNLLIFGIVAIVVLGAAALIAKQVLVGYLTPDFFVKQIESRWNCRAEIESVSVNLLGTAAVEVSGVALATRDSNADQALPLADRTPLDEKEIQIRGGSVLLEVRPADLIKRRLNIRQFIIDGLMVSTTLDESGDVSIERLFDPVVIVNPQAAQVSMPDSPDAQVSTSEVESATINLAPVEETVQPTTDEVEGDLQYAAVADQVEVRDGTLDFLVAASGAQIRLEHFSLSLTEIDLDPAALESHNRAQFQFGGDLIVHPSPDKETLEGGDYLRSHLSGQGKIRPFDPETGRIDPVWSAELTLHKGAEINTLPIIARLQEMLKEYDTGGVDLSDLNLRGTLLSDASTEIGHAQGKYLIKKPLELELPDTLLVVHNGSWLHTGTNTHKVKGQLVASEPLTQKVEGKVKAYFAQKAQGLPPDTLKSLVMAPLMKDGRLTVEFSSEGDMKKPTVDILTPLGKLSDVIDTGKSTLDSLEKAGKSLLKNLFGN